VTVLFQDDLSSNRLSAVSAFRQLTSIEKVASLINCSTSTLSAVAPILNQVKIPTVILWDSNRDMPRLSPFAIGFGYSNEKAAEDAADFLVLKKHRKLIAIFSYTNDWSALLTDSFVRHLPTLGAVATLSEAVDGNTTDFRSLILRAKQYNSDALYLPLFGAGLTAALKQAKELHFSGDILTVDSLGEAELADAGGAAQGIFVSQIFLQGDSFATRLHAMFPTKEASSVNVGYSALGYDGMQLTIQAFKRARGKSSTVTGSSLLEEFKQRTFTGELGSTTISSEGIADRAIPILQIKEGKFSSVAP
jgi:branched-chain amino acid transport system substrate-binding protein